VKQPESESDPLYRIYEVIQAQVQKAVRPVANVDPQWSDTDITKRLVKYIYKAASTAVGVESAEPWEEQCREFVEAAMMPIGSNCHESEWFLHIDLEEVMLKVGVLVMKASLGDAYPVDEVEDVIFREFEASLNRILWDKGIWEAVDRVFQGLEEKAKNKVYGHLKKTYWTALEEALNLDGALLEHTDEAIVVDQWMVRLLIGNQGRTLQELQHVAGQRLQIDQATKAEGYSILRIGGGGDPNAAAVVRAKIQEFQAMPAHRDKGILFGALDGDDGSAADLRRVHAFYRAWVRESMNRCWGVAEEALSSESINALFDQLVAPYGDKHSFTTVPQILIHRIGAPPPGWPFVSVAVQEFLTETQSWGGRKKRRRDQWNGSQADGWGGAPEQRNGKAHRPQQSEEQQWQHGGLRGHPGCTSGADCIGTAEDKLVQHILDGNIEDKYCLTCWGSFLERNPDLEGIIDE